MGKVKEQLLEAQEKSYKKGNNLGRDQRKFTEYERCKILGMSCSFGICSECEEYHQRRKRN